MKVILMGVDHFHVTILTRRLASINALQMTDSISKRDQKEITIKNCELFECCSLWIMFHSRLFLILADLPHILLFSFFSFSFFPVSNVLLSVFLLLLSAVLSLLSSLLRSVSGTPAAARTLCVSRLCGSRLSRRHEARGPP